MTEIEFLFLVIALSCAAAGFVSGWQCGRISAFNKVIEDGRRDMGLFKQIYPAKEAL